MTRKIRCAIYTRKSTEEGLDQSFNSLHAQRAACEAYILSQAGEGWVATPALYDDGGFSGGSMERPALKRMLADISAGKVDVVVVYKVDRLTRSLTDFAKIVEAFDSKSVSFVSVTQAFNTTTSMGRLTLNVLLSFAQFEREVTGERIRDKIAASKAKGLWMGGRPPLGYDARDQRLVVNEAEAQLVRSIFQRYLELGSVVKLAAVLAAEGRRSKSWTTKDGRLVKGGVFSRGALGYLLKNPLYLGAIRHKKALYPNSHPAIIDEDLWRKVQESLDANGPGGPATPKIGQAALLKGLIFDDAGCAMTPVHANKQGRRYHYYVSSPRLHSEARTVGSLPRIGAPAIDRLVMASVEPRLSPSWRASEAIEARVTSALRRVTLSDDGVVIELVAQACRLDEQHDAESDIVRFAVPIRLKRRQGAAIVTTPVFHTPLATRPDRALIRAVCLAREWRRRLETGETANVEALALRLGQCRRHTGRIVKLGYLAPDLIEMILEGRQPPSLSLLALTSAPLPLAWSDQRRLVAASA
jgi:DNA invertase Pin-like site-specific DNA recombinase